MKKSRRTKKKGKFEESYFEGYFKGAVGDFQQNDLVLSKRWFWAWLEKLDRHIPMKRGKGRRVLEIGCSIGGVASLLSERGFEVYASDISKLAVKKAQKLTPKAKFLVIDIHKKIPLKEKFDVIVCFEVVEHLEKPELAIKHMHDALKKNGYVVISTPYPYSWNFRDPTHINVKYPKEWVEIMKKVGFKKVSYHRFSLIPFFYKYHHRLQVILPLPIPFPYINSPIFYIGKHE